MASRGRPPKPIAQHILSGTFRADRHSGDVPKPADGVPTCPKDLGADAKKVWRELVRTMKKAGILTKADGWLMARFCTAVVRLRAAESEIDKVPMDDSGRATVKSLYVIIRGETDTLKSLGSALGLDPVSRTRLRVIDSEPVRSVPSRDRSVGLPPPEAVG